MDNWKLGEDELFKEDEGKKGFSIGNTDEEDESVPELFSSQKDADGKIYSGKERKKPEQKRGGGQISFRKIFYLLLIAAAFISAYYLYKTITPSNGTNISLFDLKTDIYKSAVLPETNLVVTGYLVNKNKFPIGYVKLKGKLYSAGKIVLLTKHVYAGNLADVKTLQKMSNVDIDMMLENKEGINMSNVEILPNHPIRFMIVFFDVNQNSKNYSVSISHFYRITQ